MHKKDAINTEIRKKLGLTQAQLASIFSVSRTSIALAETGKRNLHSSSNTLLTNIFLQFHELENGTQASYRTLETNLFLNDAYKKVLPQMEKQERELRRQVKELKAEMEEMKERAKYTEHAIIVFTTAVTHIQENMESEPTKKQKNMITGLNLFKQQAYDNLLTCWEPEQAKLQCKIEAIAGEARALRRYRVKVMREHNPFKK